MKRREVKSRGRKIIRLGKCRGKVVIEYKERMRVRYEELGEEAKGLEENKKYREAFRGIAEVLCGRTSGKGESSGNGNSVCVDRRCCQYKVIGEEEYGLEENINDRAGQPKAGLLHLYGQNTKAAQRNLDKVRNDIEAEVYNKLEEDGAKKMTYNLAHYRDEDSKYMMRVGGGGDGDERWWRETSDRGGQY